MEVHRAKLKMIARRKRPTKKKMKKRLKKRPKQTLLKSGTKPCPKVATI